MWEHEDCRLTKSDLLLEVLKRLGGWVALASRRGVIRFALAGVMRADAAGSLERQDDMPF